MARVPCVIGYLFTERIGSRFEDNIQHGKDPNKKPYHRESWLTLRVNKRVCKRWTWDETNGRCDHPRKNYHLVHPIFVFSRFLLFQAST